MEAIASSVDCAQRTTLEYVKRAESDAEVGPGTSMADTLNSSPIGRVRDGDMILVDGERGILEAQVEDAVWQARELAPHASATCHWGIGRELFDSFRARCTGAEDGAMSILCDTPPEMKINA